MPKSCVIVSCSARPERDRGDLLIAQSFEHGCLHSVCDLDVVASNTEGLSRVYNSKIREYAATGVVEYLVFVHDDVYIDDLKILDKLRIAQRGLGFDIIGAAGSCGVRVAHPGLWHLMSDRSLHRGFVQHFVGDAQILGTSFGPTPSEVVVIDGLFMAVHLPSILKKNWRFNENYSFHHYDLASCLDARKAGLKVGVYPIHMIHESPGLKSLDDPLWAESNRKFLAEYGEITAGRP